MEVKRRIFYKLNKIYTKLSHKEMKKLHYSVKIMQLRDIFVILRPQKS